MKLVKIPATGFTDDGYDNSIKSFQEVDNLYIDNNGFYNARGGLDPITTTGVSISGDSQIDGLFYWQVRDVTMIVSGGGLYEMDSSNVISLVGTGLETTGRAYFTIIRNNLGVESLAVANGDYIFLYDPENDTYLNLYTQDNDCPRNVKMISSLDGYILALPSNSSKFYWSTVNDPEDWSALAFAEAEGRADDIQALVVNGFYIYLVGAETVEIWYDTGEATITFARLDGGMIQNGTFSPNSLTLVQNIMLMLDNKRRIVTFDAGTEYQILSQQIEKFLSDLTTTNDAYGFPIEYRGKSFYCLTFPTDGKTIVYDIILKQFYVWGQYNSGTGVYDNLPVFSAGYNGSLQTQYLGSSSDASIYTLASDVYTDNGTAIRKEIKSGHMDLDTLSVKRVNKIRATMKQGDGVTDTEVVFSHRKNNGPWNTGETVSNGAGITNNELLQINKNLIFHNYQFSFYSVTESPFCLGDISLNIDLLEE